MNSLAEGSGESERQLEAHLQSHLGSRIRHLRVVHQDEGVILQGSVSSYHAKQIAQHLIMKLTNRPLLANEIEVC